jgi:hypothetical protein
VEDKDIPLHIQDQKTVQWLSSRKVFSVDWKTSMPQIERAWEDLRPRLPDQVTIPKNRGLRQATTFLQTELNYTDCEEIMKQLITVCGEPGEKNFLGQYKSGIVNDTSKVKALYERNNLHLAEIAHLFVHNLKYEMWVHRYLFLLS